MPKMFFDYFICFSKIDRDCISRETIFFFLDKFTTRLLVAMENHSNSAQIHFHVYMRCLTKVYRILIRVIDFIIFIFFKLNYPSFVTLVNQELNIKCEIYFSECISVRNCIKYSTKEDFDCMFKDVNEKDFHINFHTYYWSFGVEKFSILDKFVQKNIYHANQIEQMLNEIKSTQNPKFPHLKLKVIKQFLNWRDNVVDWYNDFITKKNSRALFIYGDSDSGKTSFIYSLFGKLNLFV